MNQRFNSKLVDWLPIWTANENDQKPRSTTYLLLYISKNTEKCMVTGKLI